MIALLQRVESASVTTAGNELGAIDSGLAVFVACERDDDEHNGARLAERVLTYRVFADSTGKMNINVLQAGGALLVVPQFTLAADTRKGTRASFTPAADAALASRLFDYFVERLRGKGATVACGRFGADMKVTLTNDGPVTFWLTA